MKFVLAFLFVCLVAVQADEHACDAMCEWGGNMNMYKNCAKECTCGSDKTIANAVCHDFTCTYDNMPTACGSEHNEGDMWEVGSCMKCCCHTNNRAVCSRKTNPPCTE